jgi:hypothetical protein
MDNNRLPKLVLKYKAKITLSHTIQKMAMKFKQASGQSVEEENKIFHRQKIREWTITVSQNFFSAKQRI